MKTYNQKWNVFVESTALFAYEGIAYESSWRVSLAWVITSFTGKHHFNKKEYFSILLAEAGGKFVIDE